MSDLNVATTAMTLRPPENFNLEIFGKIPQIAKLKCSPNFPFYGIYFASACYESLLARV